MWVKLKEWRTKIIFSKIFNLTAKEEHKHLRMFKKAVLNVKAYLITENRLFFQLDNSYTKLIILINSNHMNIYITRKNIRNNI